MKRLSAILLFLLAGCASFNTPGPMKAGDKLKQMDDEKDGVRITGTTFGYNEQTQIYTTINEDTIHVLRGVNNVSEIITPKLQNTVIDLNDSGKSQIIIINNDGGSRIIVKQGN